MQDIGWDKIVDAIDMRFGIEKHGRYDEPLPDRHDLIKHVAFITFNKGGRSYRIERVTSPSITDRKSIHAKNAHSGVRFENIYDPTELMHKTHFYMQSNDEWQLLEGDDLATTLA